MKEYHNGLYAVYTNFLLKTVLTILMRYMFLQNLDHRRSSYQKLNAPHRKANVGQKSLSYFGPSLWNNLNKTLKAPTSSNTYKHNIKQHYFNELKKKES